MVKIASTFYSDTHPKVLTVDGKRVARQILTCFKNVQPNLKLASCKLLDVGSSNGSVTYYLSNHVREAIGIDPDKLAISDGIKRYHKNNLKLTVFDGKQIPSSDNFFDLVVFRRVYGSTDEPETLVKEMHRVLKLGGLCYFEGHNKLFFLETDYKLPFLPFLSKNLAIQYVRLFGYKNYYMGKYQTYWGLKKIFSRLQTNHLTSLIIKNPQRFKFTRLYKIGSLTKFIPLSTLKLLEPFYPDFIWVLKKLS